MTTHIFESSDCVAKLTADIFFWEKQKKVRLQECLVAVGVVGKRRKQKVDKIEGNRPKLV